MSKNKILRIKLIDDWRQSYKLYSMWIAFGVMILSMLDIILRSWFQEQVSYWVFYFTGPGVALARIIQQYMGEDDGYSAEDTAAE